MIFEQYQLPCLSLSSYLIGDEATGRAVVVDPQRDIEMYLDEASERGLTITDVLLTHFHADYVSGHLELAEATGAEICLGEVAQADFAIRNLADGERIELGDVVIEAWATPGHTPESVSYLVYEHAADPSPVAVCSGDTLFVGDVGRPDLLGSIGFTADQLGRQLYGSVRRLAVYPGHGAGSACGKNLGSDPFTTIGEQVAGNYALQPMSEEEFVDIVTAGQPAPPAYFLHDAIMNRRAHPTLQEDRALVAYNIAGALAAVDTGAVVIDTREPDEFWAGHLRGAINVPLSGRFAEQTGMFVGSDDQVIVAGEEGIEQEAMIRLGRVGLDDVIGYIADYRAELQANPDVCSAATRFTPSELVSLGDQAPPLLDVRNPGETDEGVIAGATVVPLAALASRVDELDSEEPLVVYCGSGVRSSVAASWLLSKGFLHVADMAGGYAAWTGASAPA
jgi:hydroxyacylglutathione hydrolase